MADAICHGIFGISVVVLILSLAASPLPAAEIRALFITDILALAFVVVLLMLVRGTYDRGRRLAVLSRPVSFLFVPTVSLFGSISAPNTLGVFMLIPVPVVYCWGVVR